MSEILTDALSRLDVMRHDHGQTWDLSKNDEAAISAVLDSHAALREKLDKARAALREIADLHGSASHAGNCVACIAARALAEMEGKK